jgi:hypothetical protein
VFTALKAAMAKTARRGRVTVGVLGRDVAARCCAVPTVSWVRSAGGGEVRGQKRLTASRAV